MQRTRTIEIFRALLLPTAALVLFSSLASGQGAHGRLTPLPDGFALSNGAARLELRIVEDSVASVHLQHDAHSTSRTLVLSPQPALHAPGKITRTAAHGVITLATPGIRVQMLETKPWTLTFFDAHGKQILREGAPLDEPSGSVSLARDSGENLYGIHGLGMEEHSGTLTRNEGGTVAAGIQGNSGAPFVFTTRYGLLVDSDGGQFATASSRIAFTHSSRPDVEYFVLSGPPLQTMAALSRLAGPPPLPPKWTLGFLNSQWGATEDEVRKIVSTYRARNLPLDGFILDFDWKAWGEDNYGEFHWNSTAGAGAVAANKFPGGASGAFARTLNAQGVHLAGILKPRILTTTAGLFHKPTEAAAYATAHNLWYPNEPTTPDYFSHRQARDLDFNNAETRRWYWQHIEPAFRAGMDGWWNDEADISGNTVFNNFQFLNMGRMLYEGQRATANQRVWSINRNFYLGASRYGYAGWSGDIPSGFDSMASERRRMLAALNTGEFHWSMDTGGFHGHPSDENYARWLQFAAFVPILRVHGDLDEKRQPWVYGAVAEAAARRALELRYSLLPTIYSCERQLTEGGVGLVRPLFWQFPADPKVSTLDSEWMFSDALLVAPVVSKGATTQSIYLPAGEWFDYASGKHYSGGQTIALTLNAKSLQEVPLFVRGGSILATQAPMLWVDQKPVSEITLDIFPAKNSASFLVYDDDGRSYDYEKGAYLRQLVTTRQTTAGLQLKIAAATGSYASPLHSYLLRIHTAARSVTRNGQKLSQDPTGKTNTWTSSTDRFGAVTLLRIPAGERQSTQLLLR